MLALYTFAIFLLFAFSVYKNRDKNRLILVVFSMLISCIFILVSQINLHQLGIAFNLSDPSYFYYDNPFNNKDNDIIDIFLYYDRNPYYLFINHIVYNSGFSEQTNSILLKFYNVFIFYSLYLIGMSKIRFSKLELIILLNPYFFVTVIRNVRDLQIIGGVILLINSIVLNININKVVFGTGILLFLRPFLMFLIYISKIIPFIKKKFLILVSIIFLTLFYFNDKFYYIINYPLVAGYGFYNDFNEKFNFYLSNISVANRSIFFLADLYSNFIIGIFRFLFTPIVPNYFIKFLESKDVFFSGMYTNVDAILIIFGSVINVFIIIPILMCWFVDKYKNNKKLYAYDFLLLSIILSYSYFHLGGTDIRIRYLYMVVLILCVISSNVDIERKYIYLSIFIFLITPIAYNLFKVVI